MVSQPSDLSSFQDDWSGSQSSEFPLTPMSLPRTPSLNVTVTEPIHVNESAKAAERIANVVWVDVPTYHEDPNGNVFYEVRVFMGKHVSHIHPPNPAVIRVNRVIHEKPPMLKQAEGEPDYRTKRRFFEFQRFRHEMFDLLEMPHGSYCRFCSSYELLMTFNGARAASLVWPLLPHATKAKILSKFLQKLVRHFQKHPPPLHNLRKCHGVLGVPLMIEAFLFGSNPRHALGRSESVSALNTHE